MDDAQATAPLAGERSQVLVDDDLLDHLMEVVGELVLSRNELVQAVSRSGASDVLAPAQRISRITTELQEGVMRTRMQTLHSTWRPLERIIAERAAARGCTARLVPEGDELDIDRSILAALAGPLADLVGDAVEHIEPPAARAAARKPIEAAIRIRAFHDAGHVAIEVMDDGAGPGDPGIGFAAAKAVLEGLGGGAEHAARPGHGTTVRLAIPLTLAIIPALVVGVADQRFAVPQGDVVELVRLQDAGDGIEHVHGAPVHRLRGELLPLVDLAAQLGIAHAARCAVTTIVVLRHGSASFGLVVDAIHDSEEIVVKSLDDHVRHVARFSGATTMGDGRVALILDVRGIAEAAGLVVERTPAGALEADDVPLEGTVEDRLLLVAPVAGRRVATPLRQVDRLERVETTRLERGGGETVLQHGGTIVPVIDLAAELALGAIDVHGASHVNAVMVQLDGQHAAVLVGEIIDIVDAPADLDLARGTGITVVAGRVTDVIDIHEVVARTGLARSLGGT